MKHTYKKVTESSSRQLHGRNTHTSPWVTWQRSQTKTQAGIGWGDFAANEDCWDDGQWCLEGGAGVEFQIACSLSEEQISREVSEQFDFQRAFRAARALIDATQEVEERRAEYEAAIAGM